MFIFMTTNKISLKEYQITSNNNEDYNKLLVEIIQNTQLWDNNMDYGWLLSKDKNKYSLLEKYVYELAQYSCNNADLNFEECTIEFWTKHHGIPSEFHIDCDEHIKFKTPLNLKLPSLSNIFYINDNNLSPTLITEIDLEKYMYKEFNHEKFIGISVPKKNKLITFNGTNYHGVLHNCKFNNPRYIIAFNIWKSHVPLKLDFFRHDDKLPNIYDKNENLLNINNQSNIKTIEVSSSLFKYNFFEEILYNSGNDIYNNPLLGDIYKILKEKTISDSTLLLKKDSEYDKKISELKNNNENNDCKNHLNEIIEFIDNDKPPNYLNRFLQRFHIPKYIDKSFCNLIIKESEKMDWTTNRHDNYPTTDIPVNSLTNIKQYLYELCEQIIILTNEKYNLSEINLKINDLFVVKYEDTQQSHLKFHTDGSIISFNILLNNNTEFQGGGTYFNDGLTINPNQGDLIIHSGKIKHAGIPLKDGKRYLLVGFLGL